MQIKTLKSLFKSYKEDALFGRYIHHETIAPLLKKMREKFTIIELGKSVNGVSIHAITFGSGKKKILMWSQMHGNESTTTKAVFDMLNVFFDENNVANHILEQCTVCIIPILNPDGAKAYTRFNANAVDLNRDAQELSQPESEVLRQLFDDFQPHYCYNLHGQRTIFSAGETSNSATVSFLSPAQDEDTTVTTNRKIAMEIIAIMNDNLQQQIENQVGIYDDAFNVNCVGDTFQKENVPTILFEAGHYKNDYTREQTREFIFQSLFVSLDYIASNTVDGRNSKPYFDIPKNKKLFYDIIIRNASGNDIAIQYQEKLIENDLKFVPKIEKISDLSNFYGHREINASGYKVFGENNSVLGEGDEIVFVMVNNEKFALNL